MTTADRRRLFARRAMWASVGIGILGAIYFTTRGEPITGLVLGLLFGGGGYLEYKRRLRDFKVEESPSKDPFEERERRR